MSANDKRDYTCMTKLVSLIVVQSSGEWCGNEICRFLFWYFSQYLRFLHASCLALQAYSLRFLLTLSVLDISKAPGFQ